MFRNDLVGTFRDLRIHPAMIFNWNFGEGWDRQFPASLNHDRTEHLVFTWWSQRGCYSFFFFLLLLSFLNGNKIRLINLSAMRGARETGTRSPVPLQHKKRTEPLGPVLPLQLLPIMDWFRKLQTQG